ncbi:RPB7 subunit of the RNA polymerase III [Cryptosporidium canis]|uniref:RPB7 subunit of the RNA polymerase III n=1 Tax=Cryptosporidium canis TaxID=195482 RepID=A0ABQ8P7W3_9CRYT|nr:RPB7 subunit of the RNA polymerase III [Cryptosporidium canis]KAJ1611702.1 RPB7 subunit of the RNA polymerase III [Cryptosporidium canis]
MFGTINIEDQVNVSPSELNHFSESPSLDLQSNSDSKVTDPLVILRKRINDKYLNKVVKNAGLMIYFIGFDDIGHAEIDDDGGLLYSVTFKMIAFKPYIGEIIEGVVIGSDSTGLTVSLGFFNDVKIPCSDLREPKSIDSNTKLWSWEYENHKLCYFIDSTIRFRVSNVVFNDQTHDSGLPSMVILGNVQSDGLGMISWWT